MDTHRARVTIEHPWRLPGKPPHPGWRPCVTWQSRNGRYPKHSSVPLTSRVWSDYAEAVAWTRRALPHLEAEHRRSHGKPCVLLFTPTNDESPPGDRE